MHKKTYLSTYGNFVKKYLPFLFLYLLIWTLAPSILATSVALDVSEGINWGSEWQWGYYKHPPFSSWVLYGFYQLFAKLGLGFNSGAIGVYLLSQLCVMATLFCNYQLAKKAFSQSVGVLATVLTMGIFYYTYPTLEFNHNIAQFPIWSGLALAFYLAVTEGKWSHWLWLAVLGGIGMLTKYSVFFLLLPMALYLLYPTHAVQSSHLTHSTNSNTTKNNWQLLKSAKPWVCAVLMLAIFSPHLYWLMSNDWLPLSYAQGRGHNSSWLTSHFSWLSFSVSQLLVHLPLLVIAVWQRKNLQKLPNYWKNLTASQRLILYIWLSPWLVLCLLSLVFGVKLRDMWGMPMWGLSAVVMASMVQPAKLSIALPKMAKGIAIWLVIISGLMMVYVGYGHQLRGKPSRMDWSEQAIATKAVQTWQQYAKHSAGANCSLDSVSGDRWLTALVALHAKPRPSQMFEGTANKSPWMTLDRLEKHGTLVIWEEKTKQNEQDNQTNFPDLPLLVELQSNMEAKAGDSIHTYQGQWSIPWESNPQAKPLLVNWKIYLPSSCEK